MQIDALLANVEMYYMVLCFLLAYYLLTFVCPLLLISFFFIMFGFSKQWCELEYLISLDWYLSILVEMHLFVTFWLHMDANQLYVNPLCLYSSRNLEWITCLHLRVGPVFVNILSVQCFP